MRQSSKVPADVTVGQLVQGQSSIGNQAACRLNRSRLEDDGVSPECEPDTLALSGQSTNTLEFGSSPTADESVSAAEVADDLILAKSSAGIPKCNSTAYVALFKRSPSGTQSYPLSLLT